MVCAYAYLCVHTQKIWRKRFPFPVFRCINKSKSTCNILGSFRLASAKLGTNIYRCMAFQKAFSNILRNSLSFSVFPCFSQPTLISYNTS